MDLSTYSDEGDTGQPDSYWRRRVITLAAGLSLLGLLAWAFSGGGGKPVNPAAKTSQASGVLPAAAYSGAPSPSNGVTGSASPGSGTGRSPAPRPPSLSPPAPPGPRPSAGGKPRASASGQAGAATPAAGVAAAGRGPQQGGGRSPRAVVLSLFTSRPDYYGGQDPEFELYAVSTAS